MEKLDHRERSQELKSETERRKCLAEQSPAGEPHRLRRPQLLVIGFGADHCTTHAYQLGYAVGREIAIAFSPTLAVKVDSQVLFNPELRYIEFIAPGAVSLILQTLSTLLIALAVAGEKERGTIEQLVATPIGKMDILLGKMVTYVIIGLSEAGLMMAVAVLVFGLTIHGSLLLVALLSLIFLVASLSLGTLSGVFARNQVQAVQQVYPWVLLSVFLSGVFYPIESMPSFIQPFAYVIPLTYMMHAMRAIITKGAPLAVVSGDLVVLASYSLALLLLAFRAFRKKVE